jgi:hypothetical protein
MRDEEPEIVGEIMDIEVIAVNTSIRDLAKPRAKYGRNRWRKLKGKAYVMDENGDVTLVEVHWYECHGIGRRGMKVKYPSEE